MRFEILFAPEALSDLKHLDAHARAEVLDRIEMHLRYEPTRTSKSRTRRLRGIARPQYRLRVGDLRIFYDVREFNVEVLAVIPKSEASGWLEKLGEDK